MGKIWKKLVNNVKKYIFFFVLNYKELEVDSLDFLFGIAAKLLSYAAEILSLLFIFELVPEINGWDKYQVFFVYGLNLDGFDDDSFGEFATGIVILIYSWVKLKISPWYLPVALIAAVSGCFIYAGISILLSSFSFFTVGNADVANFTTQIKDIAKYPMTIYPKVLQFVFTFIFPVAFVAFLPMRMIMGDIGVFLIMLVPLVSGAFYWFSKKYGCFPCGIMAAAGVDKHFVVCPGIYIARARPVWKVFMKEFGEDYQLFKQICHDGYCWEFLEETLGIKVVFGKFRGGAYGTG